MNMRLFTKFTALGLFTASLLSGGIALAHEPTNTGTAQYIANEGVMVESGDTKILFDPIFNNGFNNYQLVAPETRKKLMAGQAPFDGVDAVFVSHAHGDHFAAREMIKYLSDNASVKLFAPAQALVKMQEHETWDTALLPRIFAQSLSLNSSTDQVIDLGGVPIGMTRLRVPHAGGERHAKIENIVFRVSLGKGATVMHLGDADTGIIGADIHAETFGAVRTNLAFAPFWFVGSDKDGEARDGLNTDEIIGVHVPVKIPPALKASGADYFSVPGETRVLSKSESEKD